MPGEAYGRIVCSFSPGEEMSRVRLYHESPGVGVCQRVLGRMFVREEIDFSETGCWLAKSSLTRGGYGSACATTPEGKISVLLHRVAFTAWHGRDVLRGMVASHLCRRAACFNPLHVVEESQEANLRRSHSYCAGTFRCAWSGHVVVGCPHVPMCMQETVVSSCCCASVVRLLCTASVDMSCRGGLSRQGETSL
ncbi:uncharacterized protein B0I36DRAFT_78785 [Microdochium trichocladiopsis]|uniref:Zinc-binding loop region of homing endonuclease domain-containing protein n=1 Tax=Microdochium trichocladiopsis TaxID=1682393 RepID=A0A9P8YG94_9PEZI|nr:uncharacterized protein B0I36DRAFT_78785 [Microdochium trichocladiopsis]KAH7038406.1 hypothetical protein B0I36DRAFT_78785 [Microdochium trichocladiopsis]